VVVVEMTEPGAGGEQAADVVAVFRAAVVAGGGRSDQDQASRRRGEGDQAPTEKGNVGHPSNSL
jgi:hypothetical protein